MRDDWVEVFLPEVSKVLDNLRKPVNSTERNKRIQGKSKEELFPYYGATGQVGFIDDYLTDGEYVLLGEDAAPFLDYKKDVAFIIKGKTWVNNHAHILKSHFDNRFLCHFLNQFHYREYVTGTTRLKLTQGAMKKMPIKLAPLPEQRAIVAKIEELFSELDSGIATLKKAQDQLKVYRQAVLKKAFEGELTKTWREQQTDLPFAEELLVKIEEERESHYQQQLSGWKQAVEEWEANGKEWRKPKKPRPLDTSVIDDWDVQFKTPKLWRSCQIADVISDLTDYHANGSYVVLKENVTLSDTPDYAVMIRATNFEKEDFTTNLKYVDKHGYDFLTKSKLFGGELLIGKIGNAGRVYYMPYLNRKASLAMNLFALRIDLVSSKFIYYQLKNFYQEREIRNYVRGVGNPTIDKVSIRSIHINLCSKNEQNQVIQEIESRLSGCDKMEESITDSLEKAEALRQSILKKAFEGKLLTESELQVCRNQPDWEPAEKLLERIRGERE